MPKLINLDVEYVSLVDRAAVRDPSNPTEPQKFLLWKSETEQPVADRREVPQPELETTPMAKAQKIRKLESEIGEFAEIRKSADRPYYDRVRMRKAAIDAELQYLDEISPAAAEMYRHHHGLSKGDSVDSLSGSRSWSTGNEPSHQDPDLGDLSDHIMRTTPRGQRRAALEALARGEAE